MLQLDDVACVPQARRLAPCQALIAWLWFLDVGSRVDTRGCKFRKVQRLLPQPVCLAGLGSPDAQHRWTSGLGSAANRALYPPTHLLEVSPLNENSGSEGNLMEALGLISWEVGHLDVQGL